MVIFLTSMYILQTGFVKVVRKALNSPNDVVFTLYASKNSRITLCDSTGIEDVYREGSQEYREYVTM
jgi:hypothetical protein